jgi:Fe-Mn family superoxide dismutase
VKGANAALEMLNEMQDKDDFGAISMVERSLAFNVSGHILHSVFWTNLSPDGGGEPGGGLGELIAEHFGRSRRSRLR